MTQKFYVNGNTGEYIGSWDGTEPEDLNAVEVPTIRPDVGFVWDFVLQDWFESYESKLAKATTILNALTRQAGLQVTALTYKVNNLDWVINGQDPDDPDYEPATPEEIAELPVRRAQLNKWNTYTRNLGKVKAQPTWPDAPVWPVMPEPYTDETQSVAAPVEAQA
ncbi:hypothetical protein GOD54_23605 [Sinorhizobium medicae]|nr:hypothetical protein [Sinorhizobium medicae]